MKNIEDTHGIVHAPIAQQNRLGYGWTQCRKRFRTSDVGMQMGDMTVVYVKRAPNCLLCFTWPV